MSSSHSFLPGSILATIAGLAFAGACGGRTTIDDPGDIGNGGGSNDQGGTSSTTGTTTTGTSTGTTTGTSTGTTSGGFTTTTGGFGDTGGSANGSSGRAGNGGSTGSMCQNVACPDIGCGPGFRATMVPGACCPVCEPCADCCPPITCTVGSHPETLPGMFCAVCVADPKSCDAGRKEYEVFRSQIFDKYSSAGCMTDANCVIVSEINACVSRCGVALPVMLADSWKSNLTSNAQSGCSGCPPVVTPPCVPQVARCLMNRCFATTGLQ